MYFFLKHQAADVILDFTSSKNELTATLHKLYTNSSMPLYNETTFYQVGSFKTMNATHLMDNDITTAIEMLAERISKNVYYLNFLINFFFYSLNVAKCKKSVINIFNRSVKSSING